MDLLKETDLLRRVPMFAKLDPAKLKLLAFTSQYLTFEPRELIFQAGEPADGVYVIMDGEVEILAEDGEPVASLLTRNQLFGELAVLTNTARTATLRARGKVGALRIAEDLFLKLVTENPDLALEVMRQLSHKLVHTHRQYEALHRQLHHGGGGAPPDPHPEPSP